MLRKQVKNYVSSPLNYQGGKARILDQILPLFPKEIDVFVDAFCGGCNVGTNVFAQSYIYNDNCQPLVGLLKMFKKLDIDNLLNMIQEIIEEYKFSETSLHNFAFYGGDSNLGVSKYNREKYLQLRSAFNSRKRKDNKYYVMLYVLIVFGFNNQIRFNSHGEYNLPVGKRDFNNILKDKLIKFISRIKEQNCFFKCGDYSKVSLDNLTENSLVYLDPPYLISNATYNENLGWSEINEYDLYKFIDRLNERNIKFALSNVLYHKEKYNEILSDWINHNEYYVHNLYMDYSNSNYQKQINKVSDNKSSQEILITNY